MASWLPRSLAGRTILTLFIGLSASHLLSLAVYSAERVETPPWIDQTQALERAAVVAGLVEAAAAGDRPALIQAADAPLFHVRLAATAAPAADDPALSRQMRARLGGLPDRQVAVALSADHDQVLALSADHDQVLRAAIETPDRLWLTIEAAIPHRHPFWGSHAGVSALVMMVAILAMAFWVVRRLTRPLSEVAAAAERFGQDVAAPPLPETGPDEVRRVACAFNRMQRQLRRFVEDRTRMLAAISHDLRTPITLLRLRTEFITDLEQQTRMRANLDEMEAMISATLAFARDDTAREASQTVDLVGLVASLCDDMADAGLPVSFEPLGRLPMACRLTALRRAFTNLVNNAIKYGGAARVVLTVTDGAVIIAIDDDGPGIPEDEQENVFQPFYRLDSSRNAETGGVGLGLSVARTILHAHGGDIRFRNRPEGGLRVTVTLPRPVAGRGQPDQR
jgi:signal transduction histidine kinase